MFRAASIEELVHHGLHLAKRINGRSQCGCGPEGLIRQFVTHPRHICETACDRCEKHPALKLQARRQIRPIDRHQQVSGDTKPLLDQSRFKDCPITSFGVFEAGSEGRCHRHNGCLKDPGRAELRFKMGGETLVTPMLGFPIENPHRYGTRRQYRSNRTERLHPCGCFLVAIHPLQHRLSRTAEHRCPDQHDAEHAECGPSDDLCASGHTSLSAQADCGVQR